LFLLCLLEQLRATVVVLLVLLQFLLVEANRGHRNAEKTTGARLVSPFFGQDSNLVQAITHLKHHFELSLTSW
jgi:hypothetical protein